MNRNCIGNAGQLGLPVGICPIVVSTLFVLSRMVPFGTWPSLFSFCISISLKSLSANNAEMRFSHSTACSSVSIGLSTVPSAAMVQATNLVQQKKKAGIGAQARPDIDSLFYLVVIELLTAVICV